METTERRRISRQGCKCEVNLSQFNSGSTLTGSVLNFTPDGSCLEVNRPMSPGAPVLLRIVACMEIEKSNCYCPRSNAVAEVKWCREIEGREGGAYAMGVKYYLPS